METNTETTSELKHHPLEALNESDQLLADIKKIKEYISLSSFLEILELEPDGKFEIFKVDNRVVKKKVHDETIDILYARLKKHRVIPDKTMEVDWRPFYGPVKDQGLHDICWAIVAVELVTAIRWIQGRVNGTEYSYQELVDFVCPEKGKIRESLVHFCYRLNIMHALKYIIENGVQQAVDRPFDGCKEFPPPRVLTNPDLGYIGNSKRISSIEEALVHLQRQPLGAAMPIFQPDYNMIKGGIYRGPMYKDSMFMGMHAVSVTGAGIENGESFLWVRSSHGTKVGKEGYFRVSIDVMILRASKGQEHEEHYFRKPTPLLVRFCFPEVLEESEEKKIKEKTAALIAGKEPHQAKAI